MDINEDNYPMAVHGLRLLGYVQQLMMRTAHTDVTLQCEGTYIASCHRLILASLSTHFETALATVNQCAQVTLDVDTKITGVNCVDMKRIVDFMYYGRVDLPEGPSSLLRSAQALGINSLVHLLQERGPGRVAIQARDHGRHLLMAINRLALEGKFADVGIHCQSNYVTTCHRLVLQAYSSHFEAALTSTDGCPLVTLNVDSAASVDPADLRTILEFMYKGHIRLPKRRVRPVYNASIALGVKALTGFMSTHCAELNNKDQRVIKSAAPSFTIILPRAQQAETTVPSQTLLTSSPMVSSGNADHLSETTTLQAYNSSTASIFNVFDGMVFEPEGQIVASELVVSTTSDTSYQPPVKSERGCDVNLLQMSAQNDGSGKEDIWPQGYAHHVMREGSTSLAIPATTGSSKRKTKTPVAANRPMPLIVGGHSMMFPVSTKRKRNVSTLSLMSNNSNDDDMVLTSHTGTVQIKFSKRNKAVNGTDANLCSKLEDYGIGSDTDEASFPVLVDSGSGLLLNVEDNELLNCSSHAVALYEEMHDQDDHEEEVQNDVLAAVKLEAVDEYNDHMFSLNDRTSEAEQDEEEDVPDTISKPTPKARRRKTRKTPIGHIKAKRLSSPKAKTAKLKYVPPVMLNRIKAEDLAELNMPDVIRRNRQQGPIQNSKFKCDECGRFCASAYSLKVHKETHSEEFCYRCSLCSHTAKTLVTLKAHVKVKHCVGLDGKELKKEFACTTCGQRFVYSSLLDMHIRRKHLAERAYKCPYCDHRTTENSALQKHIRCIHTDDTPYSCKICARTFKIQSNLVRHLRGHSGEKPYTCTECGVPYADKKNLDHHMLKYHGVPKQHTYLKRMKS